jgi:hypothetical protein
MYGFEEDPKKLIIKLYELRNHNIIPKSSHHLKFLSSNRKRKISSSDAEEN